jgi:hypothetical protein
MCWSGEVGDTQRRRSRSGNLCAAARGIDPAIWVSRRRSRTNYVPAHGIDPEAERRAQVIACAEAVAKLAKHPGIEPVQARLVRDDLEIRPVLDTIVRRWTPLTPTRFISTAAANTRGAKLHREHVVPCRVLVDRMIMNESECRALLEPTG